MAIKTVTKIGPQDNGRKMSLEEFAPAEVVEGHIYELGRGVIVVSDVPKPKHMRQVTYLRKKLYAFDFANPGIIQTIAAGNECKILLPDFESERHPDITVYLTPPPAEDDEVWTIWIPAVAVEVVSLGSELRDYVEKAEEYRRFGVGEYWIFDAEKEEMVVHRKARKRWIKERYEPGETYRSHVLPGFEIDPADVFAAAEAAGQ